MMTALTLMDISEQLQPLVRLDTTLENASGAAMEELIIDDGVCARSALNLPSLHLVLGKDAMHQKVTERLFPGRSGYYYQDGSSDGLECFSGGGADCVLHNTVSPELTTAAPGTQSAAPGAAGSAEPAAPSAAECDYFLGFFAEVGASGGCEPA